MKTPARWAVSTKQLSVYAQELLPSFIPASVSNFCLTFASCVKYCIFVVRNDYLDRNLKSQIAFGKRLVKTTLGKTDNMACTYDVKKK